MRLSALQRERLPSWQATVPKSSCHADSASAVVRFEQLEHPLRSISSPRETSREPRHRPGRHRSVAGTWVLARACTPRPHDRGHESTTRPRDFYQ